MLALERPAYDQRPQFTPQVRQFRMKRDSLQTGISESFFLQMFAAMQYGTVRICDMESTRACSNLIWSLTVQYFFFASLMFLSFFYVFFLVPETSKPTIFSFKRYAVVNATFYGGPSENIPSEFDASLGLVHFTDSATLSRGYGRALEW